jgi:hypothetical protein
MAEWNSSVFWAIMWYEAVLNYLIPCNNPEDGRIQSYDLYNHLVLLGEQNVKG